MGQLCRDKVVLITGASRGVGAMLASRFATEGARLALAARTIEPGGRRSGSLQETAQALRALGTEVVTIATDVARPEARVRLVKEVRELLGPPSILVNNAAVTFFDPAVSFSEKRWRLMFEVQVRAPFELAQLVAPAMFEAGEGWILNISSRSAVHPSGPPFDPIYERGVTVYGMVKAALDRCSTGLAGEFHRQGVAVNSLAPWDNIATPGAGAHDLVEIGDDGFLRRHVTQIRHHNVVSDWIVITGRVTWKGLDDDGRPAVRIEQEARNQYGDLSAHGTGTVLLPEQS